MIGPVFILALYPFTLCQKCLTVIPQRWKLVLHVFVDSFQGCYKDGTEPGTIDCRWFSSVPFIIRILICTIYTSTVLSPVYVLCTIFFVVSAILIILDPYKQQFKHYSNSTTIYLLFLACMFIFTRGLDGTTVSVIIFFCVLLFLIGLLNLLYTVSLVFCWFISHRIFAFQFLNTIRQHIDM